MFKISNSLSNEIIYCYFEMSNYNYTGIDFGLSCEFIINNHQIVRYNIIF